VLIRQWAQELGFQQLGVADIDLSAHQPHLDAWLANHFHGDMQYMQRHRDLRLNPAQLHPGTLRVLSVRMDYSLSLEQSLAPLQQKHTAYISRYARGRDYHKLIRRRLQRLAERISAQVGDFGYRAFVDSAPVLERALAEKAGLGWIGKNTMLINKQAGSWFFLGELFTDLPLPVDPPASAHCGSCKACLDICPTQAFVGPNQLDARRCISYLTIELKGTIPEELRAPMGNRVFGCDDCQLICPWKAEMFVQRTEGSAIRRIGYEAWLRNLAVGLGNAPTTIPVLEALRQREHHESALVREHVQWALRQHGVTTS
jgi:epoxyqueuosine reductase